MSEIEITPLPWRQEGRLITGAGVVHTNGRLRNSLGISSATYSEIVCEIHGAIELPAPSANAEYIVRACNAYPKLVKACKQLIEEVKIGTVGKLDKYPETPIDSLGMSWMRAALEESEK
jgi:hypothetical protein